MERPAWKMIVNFIFAILITVVMIELLDLVGYQIGVTILLLNILFELQDIKK